MQHVTFSRGGAGGGGKLHSSRTTAASAQSPGVMVTSELSDRYAWHPPRCLSDERRSVPADARGDLTQVALQCSWHRCVGYRPFFFLVTQHFGPFLIPQLFPPSQVLADLKQINSVSAAFRSVYLQKGRSSKRPLIWSLGRLNEFTTCCLKISLTFWSVAWLSCCLTLAALQRLPQNFNPFLEVYNLAFTIHSQHNYQ